MQEGFRTAHLVDAVHLEGANIQRFAAALGKVRPYLSFETVPDTFLQGNKGSNSDLILLHESTTSQTFVVNRRRIVEIGASVRKGEGCCMKQYWVRVSGGRPEIVITLSCLLALAHNVGRWIQCLNTSPIR